MLDRVYVKVQEDRSDWQNINVFLKNYNVYAVVFA